MQTQGRRVYPNEDGSFRWFERGDYMWEPKSSRWMARVPDPRTNDMDMSDLSRHTVTEHEDGTITVSPSIGHHGTDPQGNAMYWHGFLERGVWREC